MYHGRAHDTVLLARADGVDTARRIKIVREQADLVGVREFEISVEVSEKTLRTYSLSFDHVVNAVKTGSLELPGGKIKTRGGEFLVRAKGKKYTGEEFEQIPLVLKGKWLGPDAENKAARLMKEDEIDIVLDLNLGDHSDHFLFCDFSENYVKINADYRT